jgi:hypothetical protein
MSPRPRGTHTSFPVEEAPIAHHFWLNIAAGAVERAGALASQPSFEQCLRDLQRESAVWHAEGRVYLPHGIRSLSWPMATPNDEIRSTSC